MDIAIIGAGNVGRALATVVHPRRSHVAIASHDPDDAGAVAAATGAHRRQRRTPRPPHRPHPSSSSPCRSASAADIAAEIGEAVARQGRHRRHATGCRSAPTGPDIDTGSSNAEELAALLPDAHVVKAFNTLFASHQADPIAEGVQLDGYVAADDDAARSSRARARRARSASTPVDVGPLVRARQLEGLAFLNIALNIANGGSWQSGWKLVGAPVGPGGRGVTAVDTTATVARLPS